MDQKTKFIADHLRGTFSISELCTTYGITRKTGYKWIDRYLHDGPGGLEDQSRKPYTAPNRTSQHIVDALINVRAHHPTWGAGKLLAFIEKRHRGWELPARSTACEILKRLGLTTAGARISKASSRRWMASTATR
jgi:transposase